MALSAPVLLDSIAYDNNARSFSTNVVSPTGGALVCLVVFTSGGVQRTIDSITSTFATEAGWTVERFVDLDAINGANHGILAIAWARATATPGSGTITSTQSGGQGACILQTFEFAAGYNTSTPIPQSADGVSTADPSATLPSAPASSSVVILVGAGADDLSEVTPSAPFTKLVDTLSLQAVQPRVATSYDEGSPVDTGSYTGFNRPGNRYALIFEVAAAEEGPAIVDEAATLSLGVAHSAASALVGAHALNIAANASLARTPHATAQGSTSIEHSAALQPSARAAAHDSIEAAVHAAMQRAAQARSSAALAFDMQASLASVALATARYGLALTAEQGLSATARHIIMEAAGLNAAFVITGTAGASVSAALSLALLSSHSTSAEVRAEADAAIAALARIDAGYGSFVMEYVDVQAALGVSLDTALVAAAALDLAAACGLNVASSATQKEALTVASALALGSTGGFSLAEALDLTARFTAAPAAARTAREALEIATAFGIATQPHAQASAVQSLALATSLATLAATTQNEALVVGTIVNIVVHGSVVEATLRTPDRRTLIVRAEQRMLTIEPESRMIVVGPEPQDASVQFEDRMLHVSKDERLGDS